MATSWTRSPVGLAVVALLLAACAPSSTPRVTPITTATPSSPPVAGSPSIEPPASPVPVTVFFTDAERYASGVPPYEVGVTREIPAGIARADGIVAAFFRGPTDDERAMGLIAVTSGATGAREIRIQEGVAHVVLEGRCASGGATYTVADSIRANLLPLPEIAWVKIYDENGETEQPLGQADSIPFCLEP